MPIEKRVTSVSRRRIIESRASIIDPACGMMGTTLCGAVRSVSTISLCNLHRKVDGKGFGREAMGGRRGGYDGVTEQ